eukprot:9368486-Pyramimonas_sp.AAC.1
MGTCVISAVYTSFPPREDTCSSQCLSASSVANSASTRSNVLRGGELTSQKWVSALRTVHGARTCGSTTSSASPPSAVRRAKTMSPSYPSRRISASTSAGALVGRTPMEAPGV